MAMRTIRRVGVLSVAKIYGALMAGMGLLVGIMFAGLSTVAPALAGSDLPPFMSAMFGVGAVVILPIVYGVMGLVMGAVGGALYNMFAGTVGGVQIDVE